VQIDKSGRIVPGRGLGGLELGAHVQEYYPLLWDERLRRDRIEDWERFQSKAWESLNFFEARWQVPPVVMYVDVRDGTVFKLGARRFYEGTFNGSRVGDSVAEVVSRNAALEWDHGYDGLFSAEGIGFLQPESDPLEEMIPHLRVDEIVVFLPERGFLPGLNVWPPGSDPVS
jgi:hypothetical protein